MGTIVCQSCEAIIDHFESEKSGVLYGVCGCCDHDHESVYQYKK